MTEIEINNFFSIIETKKKLTDQVKEYYGMELATEFNSFDFWAIGENKVSEILAFFLDPQEKHSQGDVYLKHFLKKFDLRFFNFHDQDTIKVRCEESTYSGRRIDIVVIKNNFEQVIAIENKIHLGTADQHNQINDYMSFLKDKTENNYCLIYLCPKDKTVSDASISLEDQERFISDSKFRLMNYEEHIIECLNDFGNLTQNYRVKSFLKDFEKKLRHIYMGENNIDAQHLITDLINRDPKNIELSFLVVKSLHDVKQRLKQKFNQQLVEIGDELGISVENNIIRPSRWTKNKIRFNYELGGILYGLTREEKDRSSARIPEIEDFLREKLKEKFHVSPWWPMYQHFYRNIDNDEKFWMDIKSGRAKERAKEFIQLINDNFNDERF